MNGGRGIQGSACLVAGLAVILGAFGAHGLEDRLGPAELEWYGTGVTYQLWHAFALWFAGDAVRTGRPGGLPALFFGAGILVFSGSLYAMAMTGETWLGRITPIGGLCFIVGWALLARALLHAER